jgi:cobalt-zinc-cadmium efflux system outer membrane protein
MSLAMCLATLAILGAGQPVLAQTQPATPVRLTVDEATARAFATNATYKARLLDRDLAASEIDIAREHPNPDFSYENQRDAPYHAFLLNVPIELGGKRANRVRVGEASRDVVNAELGRESADLRAEVRRAFYRLLAADRRAEFARELSVVATRARDAAQARFDSGDAPRLDLVQAELARARVVNATATIDGERAALEYELDVLIGLPSGSRVEPAGELFADGLGSVDVTASGAPVDVAAAEGRARAAEAGVGLAKALRVPDLALGGGLTYDAPPDFTLGWKFTAGLTVPLFTTHKAEVTRAEAQSAQAARLVQASQAEADGKAAAAAARARALGDAVSRTARDILPATRTLTDMAQASYESGQTGMVALLQSLQTVAETRIEAVETALAFQLALADLERARAAGVQP